MAHGFRLQEREHRQNDHAHQHREKNHDINRRRDVGDDGSRVDGWKRTVDGDCGLSVNRVAHIVHVTFFATFLIHGLR